MLLPPLEKGESEAKGQRGIESAEDLRICKRLNTVNPSQPPFEKGGAESPISLNRIRCYVLIEPTTLSRADPLH